MNYCFDFQDEQSCSTNKNCIYNKIFCLYNCSEITSEKKCLEQIECQLFVDAKNLRECAAKLPCSEVPGLDCVNSEEKSAVNCGHNKDAENCNKRFGCDFFDKKCNCQSGFQKNLEQNCVVECDKEKGLLSNDGVHCICSKNELQNEHKVCLKDCSMHQNMISDQIQYGCVCKPNFVLKSENSCIPGNDTNQTALIISIISLVLSIITIITIIVFIVFNLKKRQQTPFLNEEVKKMKEDY